MRIFLFLLIVVADFLALDCRADQVLVGQVVSVDGETGSIDVKVIGSAAALDTAPEGQQKAASTVVVTVDEGGVPHWVRPGDVIRAWGTFSSGSGCFSATELSEADGSGSSSDRTGVRRRLKMGHGMHRMGHGMGGMHGGHH